jgi:hypothetical protein
VNLAWLSEQTGVTDATLRRHYVRFIHADAADAIELSKIDSEEPTIGAVCRLVAPPAATVEKTLYFASENGAEGICIKENGAVNSPSLVQQENLIPPKVPPKLISCLLSRYNGEAT